MTGHELIRTLKALSEHDLNLSVIWIEHTEDGFDYNEVESVARTQGALTGNEFLEINGDWPASRNL